APKPKSKRSKKWSIAALRRRCSWDCDYLSEVLAGPKEA
ncbi:MAG: hypothetical protein ACI9OJ_005712, partial [Myxococcota bacterium]